MALNVLKYRTAETMIRNLRREITRSLTLRLSMNDNIIRNYAKVNIKIEKQVILY